MIGFAFDRFEAQRERERVRVSAVSLRHAILATIVLAAWAATVRANPPLVELGIEGTWGAGSVEDVHAVLKSAAAQILPHCGPRRLAPIIVRPGTGAPISLYAKGPKGQYQIELSARDKYWCQYAYQFAHELGHLLSNYDRRKRGVNLWFEEALCDTASLVALRGMAKSWRTAPPYRNWRDFSGSLESYADRLLAQEHRRLPPDLTMPAWLTANLPELRKKRGLSPQSELVAAYLLPLFERDPALWQTLAWLNLGPQDAEAEFAEYLAGWHRRAPAEHRPRIEKIQALFGLGGTP